MSVFNWNIQLNLSHSLQVPTTVYSQFYKTFFFRDKKSSKYDTLEARIDISKNSCRKTMKLKSTFSFTTIQKEYRRNYIVRKLGRAIHYTPYITTCDFQQDLSIFMRSIGWQVCFTHTFILRLKDRLLRGRFLCLNGFLGTNRSPPMNLLRTSITYTFICRCSNKLQANSNSHARDTRSISLS